MQISYNNERAFYGDLEEVLAKALSAAEIRAIYESFFYKVKKETPRKLVKADMVDAFLNLEQSEEDLQLFVDTLPKRNYQAYALLVWNQSMPVDELQKKLGFEIVRVEPPQNKWVSSTIRIKEEFPFIGLFNNRSYYYDQDLANYQANIPPAIRKWLKPYFSKPEGYNIQPLPDAEITEKEYTIFDASPTIASDLSQLADFLKRSNPSRTKKGDFTKSSLRKAESLTGSVDWYPDRGENPELALMRHTMLLDFLEGFEGSLINQLTAPEFKETLFKEIFKALMEDETMLEKWLLSHLKASYKYYEDEFKHSAILNLFTFFGQLPLNAWVTIENLQSMQFYRETDIYFFNTSKYIFEGILLDSESSYERSYQLNPANLKILGSDPLIKGMAFLLSAFGLIRLAYKLPHNEKFGTYKYSYLTRFDGAHAVRLTDVGAYVFGLSPTLKLKSKSRKMATLRLHPEQLHVTCRDLDPVTELALKDFMEPIAPEFYRMTRASLLKGCQSPKDLRIRIADFRNRIGVELPENWEQFLNSLETEKAALSPENKFKVFTLAERPDLQRHFMQDSYLRKHSLRIEGHRIAIEKGNIPLVRARLRALGYLVES